MSLIKKLEEKLENVFEKAFTRALRKKIEPVELASELERKIEETAVLDVKVPYAANVYHILLNKSDHEMLRPFEAELKEELEDFIIRKAESLGVVLLGRAEVIFKSESGLKAGEVKIIPQVRKDEFGEKIEEAEIEKTRILPVSQAKSLNLTAPQCVLENLTTGKKHGIFNLPYRIGRMEGNNLVIDDPTVSRFHAEIYREGRNFYIRDLESTNGTFVNGKPVKVRKLKEGDIITIGNTRLRWIPNQ